MNSVRVVSYVCAVVGLTSAAACGGNSPRSLEDDNASFTGTSASTSATVHADAATAPVDASSVTIPVDAGPTITITSDTTWGDGSQFCESVLIAHGVTVTIAAGATVTFGSGATLIVDGELTGSGTATTPIVLNSVGGTALWGGLIVLRNGKATLTWANLDNMRDLDVYGRVTSDEVTAQVESGTVEQTGVWVAEGDLTVTTPSIPDAAAPSPEVDAQGSRVTVAAGCN